MPRNQLFDYLTARDAFAEIRASDGWTCRHGFQDGKIGLWVARTEPPHVRPMFLTSRDQWLWARDMVEQAADEGRLGQQPLPLTDGGASAPSTGVAAAAPTRAKGRSDLHRLADSHSEGERR